MRLGQLGLAAAAAPGAGKMSAAAISREWRVRRRHPGSANIAQPTAIVNLTADRETIKRNAGGGSRAARRDSVFHSLSVQETASLPQATLGRQPPERPKEAVFREIWPFFGLCTYASTL